MPETVVFAGGDIVAFEGVSTGIDQSELPRLAAAVKAHFDRVRMWRFENEMGCVSYFWQAWRTWLRVNALSFDGKVSTAKMPLKEPRWDEFRSINSQYTYAVAHKR